MSVYIYIYIYWGPGFGGCCSREYVCMSVCSISIYIYRHVCMYVSNTTNTNTNKAPTVSFEIATVSFEIVKVGGFCSWAGGW